MWTGKGCDSTSFDDWAQGRVLMAHINDYGIISYILELLIVFMCCINFCSLATIMFFLGVGGGIGNISYGWGILIIFTCLKYLQDNRYNDYIYEDTPIDEDL